MPKIVKNPKTKAQIQKESDERRGIKQIGFKVPITCANELDELAKKNRQNQKRHHHGSGKALGKTSLA